MAKVTTTTSKQRKKLRPALSPEARENQMIALAVDLAEQQLIDGTASAQVITHFLKLGTTKAELEKEKIRKETELLGAKIQMADSIEEQKKLAEDAIKAMLKYSGTGEDDEYES